MGGGLGGILDILLSLSLSPRMSPRMSLGRVFYFVNCRAMMTKGMVFRYTWVYSKEDKMAHTYRPVVTS